MASYKDMLNAANPQQLADLLREFKIGDIIRALPCWLRKKAPVAGAPATNYNLAAVHVLVLPTDAKAASIQRCHVRAGSATGEFTPQAYGTTPATTQVAVTPNGDIAFVAADAPTDFDVLYTPEKGDIAEVTLPCAASVLTLPTWMTDRGVSLLMEAEATAGAVTGKKAILVPGAAAPATTQARLNVAKSTVTFNNATDAVTTARVKVLLAPALDANAKLASDAKY